MRNRAVDQVLSLVQSVGFLAVAAVVILFMTWFISNFGDTSEWKFGFQEEDDRPVAASFAPTPRVHADGKVDPEMNRTQAVGVGSLTE